MTSLAEPGVRSVDLEFETWERLRRRLQDCEGRWAAAVTAATDARLLAGLQRELAELRGALDEVFRRAMRALEQAPGAPGAE